MPKEIPSNNSEYTQNHYYKGVSPDVSVIFIGPLSPDMELFIKREESFRARMLDFQIQNVVEKMIERGFAEAKLNHDYFLPTITTASAEEPV